MPQVKGYFDGLWRWESPWNANHSSDDEKEEEDVLSEAAALEEWGIEKAFETPWQRFSSNLSAWFDDQKKGIFFFPYLAIFITSIFLFGSNSWQDPWLGLARERGRSWLRRGALGLLLDFLEMGWNLAFGEPTAVADHYKNAQGVLGFIFRMIKHLARGFTDEVIQENPGIINLFGWVALAAAGLAYFVPGTFTAWLLYLYSNVPFLAPVFGNSPLGGIAAFSSLSISPFVSYSFLRWILMKTYFLLLDLGSMIYDWGSSVYEKMNSEGDQEGEQNAPARYRLGWTPHSPFPTFSPTSPPPLSIKALEEEPPAPGSPLFGQPPPLPDGTFGVEVGSGAAAAAQDDEEKAIEYNS